MNENMKVNQGMNLTEILAELVAAVPDEKQALVDAQIIGYAQGMLFAFALDEEQPKEV